MEMSMIVQYAVSGIMALGLLMALVATASWPFGNSRFLLCVSLLLQVVSLVGSVVWQVWLNSADHSMVFDSPVFRIVHPTICG